MTIDFVFTHFTFVHYCTLFNFFSIFTLIVDNVKTKRLPFRDQYLTDNQQSQRVTNVQISLLWKLLAQISSYVFCL
jgi:hypothetical protein